MASHPVRIIRFQDDWELLSAEFQTSFSFLYFRDNMSQDLTYSQNNTIIDTTVVTNSNSVWCIIHEMSVWWEHEVQSKAAGEKKKATTILMPCSWCLSLSRLFLQLVWVPSVIDVSLPWHLSALPSCLTVPSPSLWGGTVCFWRLVCVGWNMPLLQATSSLFSSSDKTWQPSPLFGAEMSCFSCPHGESDFFILFFYYFALLSPSWTPLEDSRSILQECANTTCSGLSSQTLCNFLFYLFFLQWYGLRLYTLSVQKEWMFDGVHFILFFKYKTSLNRYILTNKMAI